MQCLVAYVFGEMFCYHCTFVYVCYFNFSEPGLELGATMGFIWELVPLITIAYTGTI